MLSKTHNAHDPLHDFQKQQQKALYLSLGRLIFGCVGQRLLRAKSLRTILMAFPSTTLVLASSRP